MKPPSQIQIILQERYPDLPEQERERMREELHDLYTGLCTLLNFPEQKAMEKITWYAKYHDFIGEYQRKLNELAERRKQHE